MPQVDDVAVRRALAAETAVVVGMTVGLSALRSVLSFIASATAPGALSARTTTLNASRAPGQPWIDLGYQLVYILALLLPVALVLVLLVRGGERAYDIGLRTDRLQRDTGLGLLTAAVIGGTGLTAYLIAHSAGASLTVVPTNLPDVWWRIPVLVLSAIANAGLEEVVLVGYLVRRCAQLGLSPGAGVAISAAARGAYHLYQGVAGCLGNAAMGALFALYYQRTGRVVPLVVAHAAIDIVAFVGYVLLVDHVSWLPR